MIELTYECHAHISCRNSRGMIMYIEETLGGEYIPDLFIGILNPTTLCSESYHYLGKPLTLDFFRNVHNWYSNEINMKIFANMKAMGIDSFDTGYYSVKSARKMNNLAIQAMMHTMGPTSVVKRMAAINRLYNRTKTIRMLEYSRSHALIEACYGDEFNHDDMVSRQNLGAYFASLEAIGAEGIQYRMVTDDYSPGGISIMRFDWKPYSFWQRFQWAISYLVVLTLGGRYVRSAHAIRKYHPELQEGIDAELAEKEAQRHKTEKYYKQLIEQKEEREKELNKMVARKTAELKQSLEGKERLFENFSHELKTPLTLIIGPLEQVLAQPLPEELSSILQGVNINAHRLFNLVNELLRLAEEKVHVDLYEEINPDVVIQKIIYSLQPLAKEYGAELQFISDSSCSRRGSRLHLQTLELVVTNLVVNAIKHGALDNKIRSVIVSGKLLNNRLVVEVGDSNPAIPDSRHKMIFKRFNRSESSDAGHGLGLALVKELLEKQGGSIALSSTSEGNSFCFSLPLRPSNKGVVLMVDPEVREVNKPSLEAIDSKPEASRSTNANQKTTLLLVEDNHELSIFLRSIFEAHYELFVVDNGVQALEVLDNAPIDMIISDVMMPEMDGFELCRSVKSNDDLNHIPLILLTAKSDINSQKIGLELQADDYISKPFNTDLLLSKVYNLMATRRAYSKYLYKKLFSQAGAGHADKENVRIDDGLLKAETALNGASESTIDKKSQLIVEKIQVLLEENYHNPDLKSAYFSTALHMTERTLNRKLKTLLGNSVAELLREYRLLKARDMLVAGKKPKEVCFDCGFNSEAYFSRVYKDRFGILASLT